MTTNETPETQAARDAREDATHDAEEANHTDSPAWAYCGADAHADDHEAEAAEHESQGNAEAARDHRRWAAQHRAAARGRINPTAPHRGGRINPCGCECSTGGFCGGCGHAGCARR